MLLAGAAACGGDDTAGPPVTPPATTSGGTAAQPATTPAAPPSSDAPDLSQFDTEATLRGAQRFAPTQFDPHVTTNFRSDRVWQSPVYDLLLQFSRTANGLEVTGNLATGYEVSDDGLTITFALRDDVWFTDGTKFDSAAVKANIERAQTVEGSLAAPLFARITSIDTPDETTAVFHLSEPDNGLLYWLASPGPGFMVSPAAMDGDLARTPVGTSAFVLDQATEAGVTYQRRTDGHIWNPQTGLVKSIVLSAVVDDNARVNGFRAGEFDVIDVNDTTYPLALDLEAEDLGTVHSPGPSSPLIYYFNTSRQPFDDVRVRRALSLAIDRAAMNEALFEGNCPPTDQLFPDGIVGHIPDLDAEYDPDEARRLLAEAGAENLEFDMMMAAVNNVTIPAEAVQQMWAEVGVTANLVPIDGGIVRSEFRSGRGDVAAILLPVEPPDPGNIAGQFIGIDNPGGNTPPELVELVATAQSKALVDPTRPAAFEAITNYLQENPLHIFACAAKTGNMFSNRVVQVAPSYDFNQYGGMGILAS